MEPPRRRPQREDVARIERARKYRAHDEAAQSMGGFAGRDVVDFPTLKRLATLPAAEEYFAHNNSHIGKAYHAAVLKAFRGKKMLHVYI